MDQNAALASFDDVPPRAALLDRIDRLAVPADAKALLADLGAITLRVGGKLIAAGRAILAFILETVARFPNTAFGLIVALVVSALIASVPLIGALLGPLLAPLLIAFGLTKGAVADLAGNALNARVRQIEDQFIALGASA